MNWEQYFEALNARLEDAKPGGNKHEALRISGELHELEHRIHRLRQAHDLATFSSRYRSPRIADSFSYDVGRRRPWRALDYQYYLLGEMLLSMDEVRPAELMQHKLLFRFLDRMSEENFFHEDIEVTSSGATRCETNTRFALQSLRDAGLVVDKEVLLVEHKPTGQMSLLADAPAYELFDASKHARSKAKAKKTWSLSYFGFWVTMSFMLEPLAVRGAPTASIIQACKHSNHFFSTDPGLWERVECLRKNEDDLFVRTFAFIARYAKLPMARSATADVISRYYELYIQYRDIQPSSKKAFKDAIRALEQAIGNQAIVERLIRGLKLEGLKQVVGWNGLP